MSSGICKLCQRPLNEAQWRIIDQYKSCPRCSTENGEEHVYYKYPDDFGTTDKRSTTKHPEGAQSYCVKCRDRGKLSSEEKFCSEF